MHIFFRSFICLLNLILIISYSCSTNKKVPSIDGEAKIIKTYMNEKDNNFRFIGYDINIDNPENDRRSYYRIFIDKVDVGRTTIALESQKKTFESRLLSNRHLLIVEKWALDEKRGKYIKLNNIEQPKPHYKYFNQPENRSVIITLKNDPLKRISDFIVEVK